MARSESGPAKRTDRVEFEPIGSGKAFEEVSRQIRDKVKSGALAAGDRLPSERSLAEQFGINRNTVRQALRSLQATGLLELRAGRSGGAFVRTGGGEAVFAGLADLSHLGIIQPEHLSEARIMLGATVARLASERRTADDLVELARNVARCDAAQLSGDAMSEREQLGFEYHRLLAKATRNPVLAVLTDAIIQLTSAIVARYGAPDYAEVLALRKQIFESVAAREADRAAEVMERLLRTLEAFYIAEREKRSRGRRKG